MTLPPDHDPRQEVPRPDAVASGATPDGEASTRPVSTVAAQAIRTGRGGNLGTPPVQVIIGWIGESSRSDVLAHARGFAEDHLETLETAWVRAEQFLGGWLFEIHEGGSGQSYLPGLVEALNRDPDQILWLPSGTALNRVLTVRIEEGQVFASILNEEESALVRASGRLPMERNGRMRRLLKRGEATLAGGIVLCAIAFLVMVGTLHHARDLDRMPVPSRALSQDILPHTRILELSRGIREDRWVSRILFEEGRWRAEFETLEPPTLPIGDDQAQEVIDAVTSEEDMIRRNVRDAIERETRR